MYFIIQVEGVRGIGKSTLAKQLQEDLQEELPMVLLEEEPSNGLYGSSALHRTSQGKNDFETMLLFCLDRYKHMSGIQAPDGAVIICSRYLLSTMAYQGVYRKPEKEFLQNLETLAAIHKNLPLPEVTIYLEATYKEWVDQNIESLSSAQVSNLVKGSGDRANLRIKDAASEEAYNTSRTAYEYALYWIKRHAPYLAGDLLEPKAFQPWEEQREEMVPMIVKKYKQWKSIMQGMRLR